MAGVLWMLAAVLSIVAVNGVVRGLGPGVPSAQAAFVRFAIGVLLLLPAVPQLMQLRVAAPVWALFGLRGLAHSVAVVCWFFAMAHLPIAEVTAINYLNPVLVTLGGAILFREGLSWQRAAAVVVALIGTLIILRPGMRAIEPGHIAQLCAAFMFATSYLTAKKLSSLAPATTVVMLMTIIVTIVLAPLAWSVWVPLNGRQWLFLAMAALFGTLSHYCMTRAFKSAPLTVTQPVTFSQLVFAALIGWLVFGEPVDPYVMIGGASIILALAYLTWRDARRKRQARI
ncbi:DMT family transporter [Falsirhodobacter sp. alg1]|uniref:DMT family transporter n=1 Tax=Falsirhodobacter sp. alg1 TaxID=1472418 RepID=UPI000A5A64F9|nr:DMT family transporter [Falsirhodobacter sp. alg1]